MGRDSVEFKKWDMIVVYAQDAMKMVNVSKIQMTTKTVMSVKNVIKERVLISTTRI